MPKKRKRRKSIAEKSDTEIYLESLEKTDPIINLILNGHLLLEREVNNGLKLLLEDPDQLPRLTFTAKFALLKALTGFKFLDEDNIIQILNRLRNHIAHSLDQSKLQELIQRLRKAMEIEELQLKYRPSDRIIIRSGFISQTSRLKGAIEAFHIHQTQQIERVDALNGRAQQKPAPAIG